MANELALRRLAKDGLTDLDVLWETVRQSYDHAKATGDARFTLVAQVLDRIAREWDEDDAIDVEVGNELSAILKEHLPAIISATPETAPQLAQALLTEVVGVFND